jgi:hypothetical protein
VGPTNQASAHGANTNGCGGNGMGAAVPELVFHRSCDTHDRCYHNKPFGNNARGRLKCDDKLLENMLDDCKDKWGNEWARRNICKAAAQKYYRAVRTAGGAFF